MRFAVVFVVACRASAPAPVVDGCTRDDECEKTTTGQDCCSHCESVVGTKKSIDAITAACNGKAPSRCPQLDCPYEPSIVKCASNRCVLVKGKVQE